MIPCVFAGFRLDFEEIIDRLKMEKGDFALLTLQKLYQCLVKLGARSFAGHVHRLPAK